MPVVAPASVRLHAILGASPGSLGQHLDLVATPPHASGMGSSAELSRLDGADWLIVRLPGEDDPGNDAPVLQLAAALPRLPAEIRAVAVRRQETSPSGRRETLVIRAWRPGALRSAGTPPDGAFTIEGRVETFPGAPLTLDRCRWNDLPGRAERAEREQDWSKAERNWKLLGDGSGPWAAYGLLRAAIARARHAPASPSVAHRLLSALQACPALPEIGLRLAGWSILNRRLDDAVAWAAMADAIPTPAPGVPHLEGAARWLVPARMAQWLADTDPVRASGCARMALQRTPPCPWLVENRGEHRPRTGTDGLRQSSGLFLTVR